MPDLSEEQLLERIRALEEEIYPGHMETPENFGFGTSEDPLPPAHYESVGADALNSTETESVINTLGLGSTYFILLYVFVDNRYAYICGRNNSNNGTVSIIDIKDEWNPMLVGQVSSSSLFFPRAVTRYGDHLILMDRDTELVATIDVSNPAAPTLTSTIGTDGSGNALGGHEFGIKDGYVFSCGWSSDTFYSVDITDPTTLTVGDSINRGDSNGGHSVAVKGDYAYLSSFTGSSSTHTGEHLEVYDISDPTAITSVATLGLFDELHDIMVRDDIAITPDNHGKFTTIDISTPSSPVQLDTLATGIERTFTFQQRGNRIITAGADSGGNPTYITLDISDPSNLSVARSTQLSGTFGPTAVDASTEFRFLYTVNDDEAFRVIDTHGSPNNRTV